jgi:hypothetical protein
MEVDTQEEQRVCDGELERMKSGRRGLLRRTKNAPAPNVIPCPTSSDIRPMQCRNSGATRPAQVGWRSRRRKKHFRKELAWKNWVELLDN